MLKVNISSMKYPGAELLMKGVAFKADAREVVSLLGPSGAGKTTLLRIIAGLEKRFEGTVLLDENTVSRPSRQIQVVFQDNRILPWKRVLGNVAFALKGKSEGSMDRVDRWIENVNLSRKKKSWPKELSGGEEARVAFARAFVYPPRVLLLDEPFRNLDIITKRQLGEELLGHLASFETMVVMVSHSVEEAVALSDKIIVVSGAPMRIVDLFSVEGDKRERWESGANMAEVTAKVRECILKSGDGGGDGCGGDGRRRGVRDGCHVLG